ncbi:MAG: hypothetical protein NTU58_04030 [Candidatus Nealsonbacteria bacterium]|nr:hypothetical protein [Candidatus Nealsonbacteria bacterium]
MYPPHLLYLKEKGTIWFNPCWGLNGFWNEYRKLKERLNKPHDYVWNHRDLKRAKEIYATSIVAIAVAKQNKTKWWIQKPEIDPPDGVIGTIIQKDNIQEMHIREVEVVEQVKDALLDTIRNKLSRKQYEPNTMLVCYISQGGIFDFKKESEIIAKEITSLNHIFLVFDGLKLTDIPQNVMGNDFLRAIYKTSLVQIKPVFSFITIDPIEDCKLWRDGKDGSFFIFEGMGRGGSRPITLENPPKLF